MAPRGAKTIGPESFRLSSGCMWQSLVSVRELDGMKIRGRGQYPESGIDSSARTCWMDRSAWGERTMIGSQASRRISCYNGWGLVGWIRKVLKILHQPPLHSRSVSVEMSPRNPARADENSPKTRTPSAMEGMRSDELSVSHAADRIERIRVYPSSRGYFPQTSYHWLIRWTIELPFYFVKFLNDS